MRLLRPFIVIFCGLSILLPSSHAFAQPQVQTFTYNGPTYNQAGCDHYGIPNDQCLKGSHSSGSVTFLMPSPTYDGYLYNNSVLAYQLTSPGVGQHSELEQLGEV